MIWRTRDDLEVLLEAVAEHEEGTTYLQVFRALLMQLDPVRLLGAPTQQLIADEAGVDLGTARRYLQRMEDERLISSAWSTQKIVGAILFGRWPRRGLRGRSWYLYTVNLDHRYFEGLRRSESGDQSLAGEAEG